MVIIGLSAVRLLSSWLRRFIKKEQTMSMFRKNLINILISVKNKLPGL